MKSKRTNHFKCLFVFLLFSMSLNSYSLFGQTVNDDAMLNQFIQSKGYHDIIEFNSSNIKQFWVDNTVVSDKGLIHVFLPNGNAQRRQSKHLPIQLANVSEMLDCKIDVITEDKDIEFTVYNRNNAIISKSVPEDSFLQYNIVSALVHLEDINGFSFVLRFNSPQTNDLSIKKILLSFSENKNTSFRCSPGIIAFNKENIEFTDGTILEKDAITAKGRRIRLFSKNNFYSKDNEFSTSITITNVGDVPTTIYLGYEAYAANGTKLDPSNYPFSPESKSVEVISVDTEKRTILVDSMPLGGKSSRLAFNVKDDLSDIPNFEFVGAGALIGDIKEQSNGQAVITMSSPHLKTAVPDPGAKLRVHGIPGSNIYTNIFVLQPGEKKVLTNKIKKDDNSVQFSGKALPKGVSYVKSLIFSFTSGSEEDNTIMIEDYSLSY